MEYAVIDYPAAPRKSGEDPATYSAPNTLPVGFHPAGHLLIWEDENHCFSNLVYSGSNWGGDANLLQSLEHLCKGSATFTPNGAGILHWMPNEPGVTLYSNHGKQKRRIAESIKFTGTPSVAADGRGIVGVESKEKGQRLLYIPVDLPLADVANAWMFLQSPRDTELLSTKRGLFRPLALDQLYQFYDSEMYHCGGYDRTVPTRPYLVTTDIFWEVFAAAYEGLFQLTENNNAIPGFAAFVETGYTLLQKVAPDSKLSRAFAERPDVRAGQDRRGSGPNRKG